MGWTDRLPLYNGNTAVVHELRCG